MKGPKSRPYDSAARKRQAQETKGRIIAAAKELLAEVGYEAMTIDAVAKAAGVASQTVYAAFASKKGIVAGILDAAQFGAEYESLVQQAMAETDPVGRLRFVAKFARQIYDSERSVLELFATASVLTPELSLKERESRRLKAQSHLVAYLHKEGRLKPGLEPSEAEAILWTLSSRDNYRMLVQESGWPSDKYEQWLTSTIELLLVGP